MFKIYHSEYNPQNLTGQVGGSISNYELSGYVGELFETVSAPPSGLAEVVYQYRKVFIKNTYNRSSTNTRVWIGSVEHEEQIAICNSSGLADYTSTATGQPVGVTGWNAPYTYADGINLGTIPVNSYTGLWIRQALSGIDTPDSYATFRLYVGGIV